MKIHIDINHPAHVHYFKNFIKIMEDDGHEIFVSARDRYPVKELLSAYDIPYFNRGKGKNSFIGKILYMFFADFILLRKALKFKPDILICFCGVYLTHVSKLIGKPAIMIDDSDHQTLNRKLYKPFAKHILTPDVFKYDLGAKQIRFKGYMELSYLHPRYFTPKGNAHEILKIKKNEPYVILRFVSWQANHDYGHTGISMEQKIEAVQEFSKYARVFITSEKELPEELEPYKISIRPDQMHEVMASAKLLYGESATMASESAMLGVPGIFIDNNGTCYTTEEEERYSIVFNFRESKEEVDKSIKKAVSLLRSKHDYQENRRQILTEKLSFTDYLTWLVKNYPTSIETLTKDKDYQDRFIYNNL